VDKICCRAIDRFAHPAVEGIISVAGGGQAVLFVVGVGGRAVTGQVAIFVS
jgi:hypothetical protein